MAKFEPISLTSASPYGNPIEQTTPEPGGLHLYVSQPRVVELPEEGKITFYFKRGPVTVVEGGEDSEGRASVDLTLTEICDVCECSVPENSEEQETENKIDEIFESLREGGEKSADENDLIDSEGEQ